MPELPEVETMCERLWDYRGHVITNRLVEATPPRYLADAAGASVIGQEIVDVCRRGKLIIIQTDGGAILCHNAMSGYWDTASHPWTFHQVEGRRTPGENDIRAQLDVSFGGRTDTLRFHDARKFGQLRFVDRDQLAQRLAALGPDALDTPRLYEPRVISEAAFVTTVRSCRREVKAALMEQDRIAGIGNIYAAEACWLAGIDPRIPGRDLTEARLVELFRATQVVLQAALDRRLDYGPLKIYRRAACPACGAAAESKKLRGRTTTWCPKCQT